MKTTYSGGEIRPRALTGTEVWNRDPLPKTPPAPLPDYELIVTEISGKSMRAVGKSMNLLLDFANQSYACGYEFVSLQRLNLVPRAPSNDE